MARIVLESYFMYGVFRYLLWVGNTVSMKSVKSRPSSWAGSCTVICSIKQIYLYYNLYLQSYITNRLVSGNGVILSLFLCALVLQSDSALSLPAIEVPNPY